MLGRSAQVSAEPGPKVALGRRRACGGRAVCHRVSVAAGFAGFQQSVTSGVPLPLALLWAGGSGRPSRVSPRASPPAPAAGLGDALLSWGVA